MRARLLLSVVFLASLAALAGPSAAGPALRGAEKPYRVLVVIGNQWDNAGSYCIDGQSRSFNLPTRKTVTDFLDVVTMLKIWGIPFDILRLDQQRLQINRFLNGVAEPKYRCVIWMCDAYRSAGLRAKGMVQHQFVPSLPKKTNDVVLAIPKDLEVKKLPEGVKTIEAPLSSALSFEATWREKAKEDELIQAALKELKEHGETPAGEIRKTQLS